MKLLKTTTAMMLGAAGLACAGSAYATTQVGSPPAPVPDAPSCALITFTGISPDLCAGGYSDNLNKGAVIDPGLAALQALGYTGTATFLEKADQAPQIVGNTINFDTLLTGITIFGIHYGGGSSGMDNATSFFRFDAGSGVNSFTVNLVGGKDIGLSNAGLMSTGGLVPTQTGSGVPEPATWAMMLVGFGLVGGAMRRKQHQAVRLTYA